MADDRSAHTEGMDWSEGSGRSSRLKKPSVHIRSRCRWKSRNTLSSLKEWLESYRPEELFDENGRLKPEIAELTPKGNARMGANPHANGGLLLKDLRLPDFRDYGIEVEAGKTKAQDMIELGGYVRDIFRLNEENKNFRIFGPDESMSNRLVPCFRGNKP